MSGSGVTYYNEELKMLLRLLKALPDTIPEGDLHDFRHYVLDPIKMKDIGTLPAPSLQDLLNPIPLDPTLSEATLFSNPDPYGQAALDEDEDDGG
ncbi:hypothetical protein B0H14DRAFT_3880001 [Mycena olivaceomarginata]|nr:hypothetical protein B0H14DRAFT_3880001 [Mycena olivaceomarginata]